MRNLLHRLLSWLKSELPSDEELAENHEALVKRHNELERLAGIQQQHRQTFDNRRGA